MAAIIATHWKLAFHAIPILLLILVIRVSALFGDRASTWFIAIFVCRYSRLAINIYSFWQYKPIEPPSVRTLFPADVSVIIPTVSVLKSNNPDLEECLTTTILNRPAELIVVTDTEENAAEVRKLLRRIHDVNPVKVKSSVYNTGIANKRRQLALGIRQVQTRLILFLDDHVFLKSQFLDSVVPVFEEGDVGLCGTKKAVRRKSPKVDTSWGWYWKLLCWYWKLLWNVMGILYLERHNFETRATNARDGGVFVISGRGFIGKTHIFQDSEFLEKFQDERFFFKLFGPLNPDDDNFITRWVLRKGYKIKVQHTEAATIETTLGEYPRYIRQCLRWARTTFRSNLCSLLTDRTVWSRWPWTVWTTFIPSLVNFALLWDGSMLYSLTQTKLYKKSDRPVMLLMCLGVFIYLTKLVKLTGYFRRHPKDFAMFFLIPSYHLFAYFHSVLKLWAALTFFDCTWTGRELLVNPATGSYTR